MITLFNYYVFVMVHQGTLKYTMVLRILCYGKCAEQHGITVVIMTKKHSNITVD